MGQKKEVIAYEDPQFGVHAWMSTPWNDGNTNVRAEIYFVNGSVYSGGSPTSINRYAHPALYQDRKSVV